MVLAGLDEFDYLLYSDNFFSVAFPGLTQAMGDSIIAFVVVFMSNTAIFCYVSEAGPGHMPAGFNHGSRLGTRYCLTSHEAIPKNTSAASIHCSIFRTEMTIEPRQSVILDMHLFRPTDLFGGREGGIAFPIFKSGSH